MAVDGSPCGAKHAVIDSAMDKLGEALAALPGLAPGIIIGVVVGLILGIRKDVKAGEIGNWWQFGGIGLVLGAIAWYLIVALS